jgi:hypothetical protein
MEGANWVCLMGTEFGMMKKFWKKMAVTVAQ